MLKRLLLLILVSVVQQITFAQDNETSSTTEPSIPPAFKPTIGFGTGMLSFYGDFYDKPFQNPLTSRIGYEILVSQRLTPHLQASFFSLFGQLGANERMQRRNLNMQSQIRSGGLMLTYNFDNFLKPERKISPYVTLGFETLEFLTKTDMYDQYGNKYYYWSDGSIRDLDQSSPIASTANFLVRDYIYESDVRELDLDGFGKYPERSLAIPIGVGAILHISKRVELKVGTTLHYTFTDYIDGVTDKSLGDRIGNKQKDKFVMTSFSLHYNLDWSNKNDTLPFNHFDGVDFLALGNYDFDGDGVLDGVDSCQGTPSGVPVDAKGCPLDDDKDGVPNYLDKELNTKAGAYVNADGIEITDSMFLYQYQIFSDTGGMFAKTVYEKHGKAIPIDDGSTPKTRREYAVQLGVYKTGISPDLMTKFLSIGDIRTVNLPDSTTAYLAGKYYDYQSAAKRKDQFLKSDSLRESKVVYFQDGKLVEATGPAPDEENEGLASTKNQNTGNTKPDLSSIFGSPDYNSNEVVFRVQLGAYKKRLSKNVFPGVNDLVEIQTDDGLYKYMAGAYKTFDEAANRKVDLALQGYGGAFVTAYRGGKRVSLQSQGVEPAANNKVKEDLREPGLPVSSIDKKLIVFKIQVGIFKSEPPAEVQNKYNKLKGIEKETTITGLSRFVIGNYNSYNEAVKKKDELIKGGLSDAFIIAFFNGQYITVQEALELSK